jgi:cardiolipin synthase
MIRKAQAGWIISACNALRSFPATATVDFVLKSLPVTHNSDFEYFVTEVVNQASTRMSWEALSWTIETTYTLHHRWHDTQHVELLWSGPSPAHQIPARRIDQALYDLIANARKEILLVTFAATKIERLTSEILRALKRGVHTRLILEFEQSSEGQLSFDALKAFPSELVSMVEVYYWPVENRERNQAGRPGKLHSKLAIIDDTALVSSANLTDDAFNRNLELGVMITNTEFLISAQNHVNSLISNGTLKLIGS